MPRERLRPRRHPGSALPAAWQCAVRRRAAIPRLKAYRKPRLRGVFRSRPVSRILSRVTIHLGRRLRDGSSGVPGSSAGRVVGTCFALHRTGFGEPPCYHGAGGLLPHLFTLTFDVSRDPSRAVSFLCHFPSAFAAWGFPSVLPFGVRTFLEPRTARGHPACRPNCTPVSAWPGAARRLAPPSRHRNVPAVCMTNSPQTRHSRLTPRKS